MVHTRISLGDPREVLAPERHEVLTVLDLHVTVVVHVEEGQIPEVIRPPRHVTRDIWGWVAGKEENHLNKGIYDIIQTTCEYVTHLTGYIKYVTWISKVFKDLMSVCLSHFPTFFGVLRRRKSFREFWELAASTISLQTGELCACVLPLMLCLLQK